MNDNFFQIVTLLQYYGKIAEGRGACRGNELINNKKQLISKSSMQFP